jgi:hypothetical protein
MRHFRDCRSGLMGGKRKNDARNRVNTGSDVETDKSRARTVPIIRKRRFKIHQRSLNLPYMTNISSLCFPHFPPPLFLPIPHIPLSTTLPMAAFVLFSADHLGLHSPQLSRSNASRRRSRTTPTRRWRRWSSVSPATSLRTPLPSHSHTHSQRNRTQRRPKRRVRVVWAQS